MIDHIRSLLRQRLETPESLPASAAEFAADGSNITPFSPDTLAPKIGAMGERAEAAVNDLSSDLDQWFEVDVDTLIDAWKQTQGEHPGQQAIKVFFQAAHNLSGMGATYGRPHVGRACKTLSKLISSGNLSEHAALIGLHIDALRAVRSSSHHTDIPTEICDALETEIAKLKAA